MTDRAAPPLFRPDADNWRSMMVGRSADAASIRFREQLGIPTDRPVVMSGHQAGFWHPGIAAKWLACAAAAEAMDAHAVWIVPDQDDNDPTQIAYPTVSESGSLGRSTWYAATVAKGVSNARRNPIEPASSPARDIRFASAGVADGLSQMQERLAVHAKEGPLASQFALAARDLLSPLCASPTIVYASQIGQTDAFDEIAGSMLSKPAECVTAYNDAANQNGSGGIRTLKHDEAMGTWELPLWELSSSGRTPVFAGKAVSDGNLAPRALLMTAILRSYACELFIHGTGGAGIEGDGGYEQVTDQWWQSWRGQSPRAKTVMTTATRTLAMEGDIPTPQAVEEARAKAHKAKHDPSLVGDDDAAGAKRALLASIDEMKERGENPSPLFREMQDLLSDYRERRADDLAALEATAQRLELRAGDAAIAHDRAWAFPLYEPTQIASLRDQVLGAFSPI